MRKTMVEKDHPQLSIRAQSELLGVNRNRLEPKRKVVWQPNPKDAEKLELIKLAHAKDPTIPVMDLNPKQMPPDYVFAHPDWDGREE